MGYCRIKKKKSSFFFIYIKSKIVNPISEATFVFLSFSLKKSFNSISFQLCSFLFSLFFLLLFLFIIFGHSPFLSSWMCYRSNILIFSFFFLFLFENINVHINKAKRFNSYLPKGVKKIFFLISRASF